MADSVMGGITDKDLVGGRTLRYKSRQSHRYVYIHLLFGREKYFRRTLGGSCIQSAR